MKYKIKNDVVEAYQWFPPTEEDMRCPDFGDDDVEPSYAKYIDSEGNVAFSDRQVGWKVKDEFGGLKVDAGTFLIEESGVDGFKHFLFPMSAESFLKKHRPYVEITKEQLKDSACLALTENWEHGHTCKKSYSVPESTVHTDSFFQLINQLDIPEGDENLSSSNC